MGTMSGPCGYQANVQPRHATMQEYMQVMEKHMVKTGTLLEQLVELRKKQPRPQVSGEPGQQEIAATCSPCSGGPYGALRQQCRQTRSQTAAIGPVFDR